MSKKKAIVLLSGGLDSTVNLYEAFHAFDVVKVLTINYGQKALKQELASAQFFANELKLSWQSLDLSWLSSVSHSALNTDAKVPQGHEVDISSYAQSLITAKSVWVPNRNGLFLNIAGVFADALEAHYVIPGFNKEEAETFPDNSSDFIKATNLAFSFSTQNKAEVFCFTSNLNKPAIVQRAKQLNINIAKLWPCYEDQETWCGQCESCLRFQRALNS